MKTNSIASKTKKIADATPKETSPFSALKQHSVDDQVTPLQGGSHSMLRSAGQTIMLPSLFFILGIVFIMSLAHTH